MFLVLGPSWPDNLNNATDFIAIIMVALLLVLAGKGSRLFSSRDLLADLRAEIITHFEAAHIAVNWQADEITTGRKSHRLAHALRAFLPEGTSNILRHSGATEATVQIDLNSDGLQHTLSDNGSGFDSSVDSLSAGADGYLLKKTEAAALSRQLTQLYMAQPAISPLWPAASWNTSALPGWSPAWTGA